MDSRSSGRGRRPLIIAFIVALVLQVGLSPQVSVLGGRFNFMLVIAGVMALSGDASRAVWVGFIAGLLYDLTASVPVGLMSLLLTISSFALATALGPQGDLSVRSIRLFLIDALVVCFANGVALVVLGYEESVLTAFVGHGLASALLSTAAAVPFMMLLGRGEGSSRTLMTRGGRRGGTRFKGMR